VTDIDALIARYLPLIDTELRRIGFKAEDFQYLGSDGPLTAEGFEAHLADLRLIPSGIGVDAYFALYGLDFAKIKHDSAARSPHSAPPNKR
jgi:hypothetical protein